VQTRSLREARQKEHKRRKKLCFLKLFFRFFFASLLRLSFTLLPIRSASKEKERESAPLPFALSLFLPRWPL